MKKKGVLLINLGTPDSPKPSDVKKYLLEFLMDDRVIDFGWLKRTLLVKGIIVPFRYKNSAKIYKEIWDEKTGSPLLFHSENLTDKVKASLSDEYVVELAMRYQTPSIKSGLEKLRSANVDEIIILPLFPQYASSSTGTAFQKVMDITKTWNTLPTIKWIGSFYDHPKFIQAFVNNIQSYQPETYDHVVFSYHGLPERHMKKTDLTGKHCLAENYSCCNTICDANKLCYRAQCKASTDLMVDQLGLNKDQYSMSFQSRLGRDPWIQPFTDHVLKDLAKQGKKKILVVCPAFVADCLETLYEISVEYQEEFQEAGGEKVQLVESLNSNDDWVEAVVDMVTS
ncbi:MAG: ferrochelatase [Chitinophagales bacterium]